MLHFFQFLTIVFGVVVTAIPLYYAFYFYKSGAGIGRVIAYMLLGESIAMSIAVYFAFNSFTGAYKSMSPELAMLMRWVIFSTTGLTTVKLIKYLKKMQSKIKN